MPKGFGRAQAALALVAILIQGRHFQNAPVSLREFGSRRLITFEDLTGLGSESEMLLDT